MSFLSLAKGDPAARDLLQRAIRARYSLRPLPIDSIRLEMTGTRRGPLGLPAIVAVQTCFVTGSHWRWDERWTVFGFQINQFSLSFDSGALYFCKSDKVERDMSPDVLQAMRRRLWGETSAFLTPLTMPGVVLKFTAPHTFTASPEAESDDVSELHTNDDDTLDFVRADAYQSELRKPCRVTIRPTGGLQTLEGFPVPKQLIYEWEGADTQTLTIIKAELNPKIPLTEFTMG